MTTLLETLATNAPEPRTYKVSHKEHKLFVMKHWDGKAWNVCQPGDVVTVDEPRFGPKRKFEVVMNEPGNVMIKEVFE